MFEPDPHYYSDSLIEEMYQKMYESWLSYFKNPNKILFPEQPKKYVRHTFALTCAKEEWNKMSSKNKVLFLYDYLFADSYYGSIIMKENNKYIAFVLQIDRLI